MDVLVIGSGAREHALAWAIARSPSAGRVFVAPGNPGTAGMAPAALNVGLDVSLSGFGDIVRFCLKEDIDLVVVGPENPLAQGLADRLRQAGVNVFGPGRRGAALEASKKTAKEFMLRHGIPHPKFEAFDRCDDAMDYVCGTSGPWVIKADGLALGKGVSITEDREQALEIVREFMDKGVHGEAGKRIVIEEFLEGREVTAMVMTDGDAMIALPLARDHKRAFDGDRGPMTGGMGAFSPVHLGERSGAVEACIREQVLERTLAGLRADGIDFRGLIYAGLMVTEDGPKVLEYNVRFGDPETQCVLPRLEGDFAQALYACATGTLRRFISESPQGGLREMRETCVTVVLASEGYPGKYRKGMPISGLETPAEPAARGLALESQGGRREVVVFHAGTRLQDGVPVTSGGRVLSVAALAPTMDEALRLAYARARAIKFEGAFYRKDIGR